MFDFLAKFIGSALSEGAINALQHRQEGALDDAEQIDGQLVFVCSYRWQRSAFLQIVAKRSCMEGDGRTTNGF